MNEYVVVGDSYSVTALTQEVVGDLGYDSSGV
jgi:hypothetical protein